MKARSTLPHPPIAYWSCQLSGWSALFLINTLTTQGFTTVTWRVVGSFIWLSALGLLVTHGLRALILRRGWIDLPVARLLPRIVSANLALALLLVGGVWLYFLLLPQPGPASWMKGGRAMAAANFLFVFNDFIILTLWSGIYFGVAFFKRQRRMEIERYQAQTALAEAELRGLKSQLNPHFFFNSLNSLRALVVEDPARAQEAITQMAAILRYHLQSGERSLVPLSDEIETVEQYLALELIRFEDRLTVTRGIQQSALVCLVPPLALQALVENAIKYGISRHTGAGQIELDVRTRGGQLEISVRNTGELRSASAQESTGVGLTNLRTRLRLLFAEEASIDLKQTGPGWVEARIVLPATHSLGTNHR
jgi:two-component sensor histidine kinase